MYGSSEEVVGDLAAALGIQPKLFLATKVWTQGKKDGIEQMTASMRKLRTARLDLMQVHNLVDVHTHLETLHEWKREGRVRYVGITHYTAGGHDAIANVMASSPVDFVQINYSVAEPEAEARCCRSRSIAASPSSPTGRSRTARWCGGCGTRRCPPGPPEIQCDSWAEVLLKFVVSHPAVTCVIPATSDATHLVANMAAARGSMPDASLRKRIAADVGRSYNDRDPLRSSP